MLYRRILKELDQLNKHPPTNCSAGPIDNNLKTWVAKIIGPNDTPYMDGIFELRINFDDNYPFTPPYVWFTTKIYHPNVNFKGDIGLGLLDRYWTPAISIEQAEPNPHCYYNFECARMFHHHWNTYEKIARDFTKEFAK